MHLIDNKPFYILDNGAYFAKIGSSESDFPRMMPNCIMKVKSERRRPFIGDQIEECRDALGLFYILPFQKGYLVNWDVQKTVWDYIFATYLDIGKLSEVPILITEPVVNFNSVQEAMDEIFFEEYECCGMLRLSAPDLSGYQYSISNGGVETCIVIDSGYSFTYVVPYIDGKKYLPGAKRIDVGGKVLTNHLKEIISYRQLHVMDETYVINQMKEDSCFISKNFNIDMKTTMFKDKRNTIVRDYVLPDYVKTRRGYVQNPWEQKTESSDSKTPDNEQQMIRMNNERITIPEILFHPSDIGIEQKGIAEAIVECIKDCPSKSKYQLLSNILVTGGNGHFENFRERLYTELRKSFDENYNLNVSVPEEPLTYAWHGGKSMGMMGMFHQYVVSKQEYDEYGTGLINKQLHNFSI